MEGGYPMLGRNSRSVFVVFLINIFILTTSPAVNAGEVVEIKQIGVEGIPAVLYEDTIIMAKNSLPAQPYGTIAACNNIFKFSREGLNLIEYKKVNKEPIGECEVYDIKPDDYTQPDDYSILTPTEQEREDILSQIYGQRQEKRIEDGEYGRYFKSKGIYVKEDRFGRKKFVSINMDKDVEDLEKRKKSVREYEEWRVAKEEAELNAQPPQEEEQEQTNEQVEESDQTESIEN